MANRRVSRIVSRTFFTRERTFCFNNTSRSERAVEKKDGSLRRSASPGVLDETKKRRGRRRRKRRDEELEKRNYSPSLHASRAVTWLTVYRAPQVACRDGDCIRTRRAILYRTNAGANCSESGRRIFQKLFHKNKDISRSCRPILLRSCLIQEKCIWLRMVQRRGPGK